jgi:hypothetical protein
MDKPVGESATVFNFARSQKFPGHGDCLPALLHSVLQVRQQGRQFAVPDCQFLQMPQGPRVDGIFLDG